MNTREWRIWIGRILIGAVFLMNVQAAVLFLWRPGNFAPAFELGGVVGTAAIRGIGLLFLMWTVPYFVALLNPVKYRISLYEALAMQSIGVAGESILLFSLPPGHPTLEGAILRFVIFDSLGLLALLLAVWVTYTPAGVPGRDPSTGVMRG
jgi:hypothetical protein